MFGVRWFTAVFNTAMFGKGKYHNHYFGNWNKNGACGEKFKDRI